MVVCELHGQASCSTSSPLSGSNENTVPACDKTWTRSPANRPVIAGRFSGTTTSRGTAPASSVTQRMTRRRGEGRAACHQGTGQNSLASHPWHFQAKVRRPRQEGRCACRKRRSAPTGQSRKSVPRHAQGGPAHHQGSGSCAAAAMPQNQSTPPLPASKYVTSPPLQPARSESIGVPAQALRTAPFRQQFPDAPTALHRRREDELSYCRRDHHSHTVGTNDGRPATQRIFISMVQIRSPDAGSRSDSARPPA